MRKILLILALVSNAFAATTTLTGTIKDSQGNPLNGTLVMRLPVPAQDTATNTAVAPTPVSFRVVNGAITGGAPLFDVNGLQPQGLYYIARAYDTTGSLQFYGYYVVTGATFNLGAATPTVITTSNVSYANVPFLSTTNLFTGANSMCNLNAVMNVGGSCATFWGGGDIGAQVNAAYTACPSSGCRIHIIAQAACYTFTTPITLSTSNKAALLEGDPGATCISYTPTTGTAITLDYGQVFTGAGIRDIELKGPGSGTTAVGVSLAPTNGAIMSRISGFRIGSAFGLTDGFGTGLQFGPLGFVTQITNSVFGNSGTGMTVSGGGIENLTISDSIFDHNTTGLSYTAANLDIHISKTSFDDNATGISAGNGGSNPEPMVTCEGCHFENAGLGTGASAYVSLNGGTFACTACQFLDDRAVGSSTQMITAGGASFISLVGTNVFSNGITITEVVNFSGTARGYLQTTNSSVAIASTFNAAYTGAPVFDLSTWSATAAPITATNTGFLISPVAFASLPACAAGLEGESRAVNNSNTATYNAAVAGGGTNHIVAYCNGTSWVAH